MTYADFEQLLVDAGQEDLVLKMEDAAFAEVQELVSLGMDRVKAVSEADAMLAAYMIGWLSGRYGELTPAAVLEHRPLLVKAWAIAGCLADLAAGAPFGALPRASP